MTRTSTKTRIGKEDFCIQSNILIDETFSRQDSLLTKIPDIWDGKGKIDLGKLFVRASDDNDTVIHAFGGAVETVINIIPVVTTGTVIITEDGKIIITEDVQNVIKND
jgi:hypothetical protein